MAIFKKDEKDMDLTQALDLKTKALNAIKSCSEFANYLTIKMDEIQKESGKMSGISAQMDKAEKERDYLIKSLDGLKKDFANEQKNQEAWRDGERKLIAEKHEIANKEKAEAAKILSQAKKERETLEKEVLEFETKRRAFEAKFEKVKELVS